MDGGRTHWSCRWRNQPSKLRKNVNAIINDRFSIEVGGKRVIAARLCKCSLCHSPGEQLTAQTFLGSNDPGSSTRSLHVPPRVFLERILCKYPRDGSSLENIYLFKRMRVFPGNWRLSSRCWNVPEKCGLRARRRRGRGAFKLTYVVPSSRPADTSCRKRMLIQHLV